MHDRPLGFDKELNIALPRNRHTPCAVRPCLVSASADGTPTMCARCPGPVTSLPPSVHCSGPCVFFVRAKQAPGSGHRAGTSARIADWGPGAGSPQRTISSAARCRTREDGCHGWLAQPCFPRCWTSQQWHPHGICTYFRQRRRAEGPRLGASVFRAARHLRADDVRDAVQLASVEISAGEAGARVVVRETVRACG